MNSGVPAPGPSKGPSLRLADLEESSRYARERYRIYKAKAYGPKLTSPERLRRLERESQLADRRLERAKAEARHAEA
jgi:hypothetical protein